MGKTRVIFLHGTGGDAEEAFFSWSKEKLKKLGFLTLAPDFPSSNEPDREAWIEAALDYYDPAEPTIFVGRSLGGSLIPYLLERDEVKAKAVFSIAAPVNNLGWENLVDFFDREPDFAKAKKSVEQYFHWYSDDDPHVNPQHGMKYQMLLGGKFRIFPGYSHFYDDEFPELVEAILAC